jgi:hypothetical protein
VINTAAPELRVTWLTLPAWKHGTDAATAATSLAWADATEGGTGAEAICTLMLLNLSLNFVVVLESERAHPSGTLK